MLLRSLCCIQTLCKSFLKQANSTKYLDQIKKYTGIFSILLFFFLKHKRPYNFDLQDSAILSKLLVRSVSTVYN